MKTILLEYIGTVLGLSAAATAGLRWLHPATINEVVFYLLIVFTTLCGCIIIFRSSYGTH